MLKRDIKFTDFEGNEVVETFYFNLSKSELIEYDSEYGGGFSQYLQTLVETKDVKILIKEFKKLVLAAYGVKSEDGKRFVKNDELREQFTQTPAYDSLFMELATDEDAASKFILGIIPADLRGNQDKPVLPPPAA